MRSAVLFAALAPFAALACDSPSSDTCASIFAASSASASAFCKTFTAGTATATTGLPAFASGCGYTIKKLSSACSCLAPATSVPASTTTTLKTTTSTAKTTTATTAPAGSGTACTCTAYSQVSSAIASCTNIVLSNIAVPASDSLDLSKAKTGTIITFAGKTTFGTTVDSDFNPIVLGGTSVTVQGAAGHVIDGNGQAYWDGQGSNGGSDKPDHFIVVSKMQSSTIKNLNIQNWPVHCFDVTGCNDLTITGLTLDNTAGDAPNSKSGGDPAAHNSDGFDFSSTNNAVLSNTAVYNQDDCVAVTSGSNVTVTGMYCSGGHGLSIGSVGGKSNNVVAGITFSNSTVINSQNGCRIKTNSGTTGSISNVVYSDIRLSGISVYGIDVQQDYLNGGPTGDPTNGVTITGLTFQDVTGQVTSSAKDYYILCGSGSCSDFTFSGVSITGGKADSCNYPPSGCP